ncbi:hypothetical protein [Paenibacillus arenilitoris]|uniref:Uncharacterized protein n=1 Tax=Paenibacillus arenilitoris TaxID=2772299 RepID=A0A927CJ89_9BACL|nr:hypothetical protein [Paenibacillus arenilitoris]MBD2868524.1 hypothetical protein [Paenibacillus arenilitoris]
MKRRLIVMFAALAAAAVALSACSSSTTATETPEEKTAIYVGNDTIGDTLTKDHLTKLGFEVTEMTDREITDKKAQNYSLVYINSTISSAGNIGTKLYNTAVPVIYASGKVTSYNDMTGTGENTDFGRVLGTALNVKDGEHPIASGLSGTVEVYKSNGGFEFIVPTGDAAVIATAADDDTKALIAVYDKGVKNGIGNAVPARRAFMYLAPEDIIYATDDGWKPFDATVQWAIGEK